LGSHVACSARARGRRALTRVHHSQHVTDGLPLTANPFTLTCGGQYASRQPPRSRQGSCSRGRPTCRLKHKQACRVAVRLLKMPSQLTLVTPRSSCSLLIVTSWYAIRHFLPTCGPVERGITAARCTSHCCSAERHGQANLQMPHPRAAAVAFAFCLLEGSRRHQFTAPTCAGTCQAFAPHWASGTCLVRHCLATRGT